MKINIMSQLTLNIQSRGKIYSFSNQETVERGKIYTPNKHLVRKDIDVNEH
jgi:uncharacterized protein (DUF2344 family)